MNKKFLLVFIALSLTGMTKAQVSGKAEVFGDIYVKSISEAKKIGVSRGDNAIFTMTDISGKETGETN